MSNLRCKIRVLSVLSIFFLSLGAVRLSATAVPTESSYTFTGVCFDCLNPGTDIGTGTLTVAGYTPGNTLDLTNFVSFSYSSDIFNVTLNFADIDGITGSLPVSFPGVGDVSITTPFEVLTFQSLGSGSWCVGINGCNLDFGIDGLWEQVPATSPVPEPATVALACAGFCGLALFRRKRA